MVTVLDLICWNAKANDGMKFIIINKPKYSDIREYEISLSIGLLAFSALIIKFCC